MSEYVVTARKWRPMRFEDVAAQHHVTQTLKNAVKQQRLAHAYLFAGPRGVGKTTTARLLAKLVNCQHPTNEFEPDNECESCREITEGRSFDVLEIDGASNRGVDEIRNLRESVRYAPAKAKYKVYIIDEVHMLTKEAFNALLKTLEEPPPHVLFIFATTEIHKLPATVISRCQRFDFRRIAVEGILGNLRGIAQKEGVDIDDDALILVAKKGDGSLRDAQSIFDQVVSLCGTKISKGLILESLNIVDQDFFFRLTDLIKAKDPRGGLRLVQEIVDRGYDIKEFLGGVAEHLRNMLTAATTGTTALIEESDHYKKRYGEIATLFTVADLLRLFKLVSATEAEIRWSPQPRFKLETALVQMITLHGAAEIGELLIQIDGLKKKFSEERTGSPPPVSSPAAAMPVGAPRSGFSRSPVEEPRPAPAPISRLQTSSLSEGEVRSRWNELVGEVKRRRISLGMVLESSALAGITNGAIRIRCADTYEVASVAKNKEYLAGIVNEILNVHIRIEAEVGEVESAPSEVAAPGEKPLRQTVGGDHPVIQALKRELGAEPLE